MSLPAKFLLAAPALQCCISQWLRHYTCTDKCLALPVHIHHTLQAECLSMRVLVFEVCCQPDMTRIAWSHASLLKNSDGVTCIRFHDLCLPHHASWHVMHGEPWCCVPCVACHVTCVMLICRFEEFGLDANLTGILIQLYNNDIDQVEWFVGLMIESPAMAASFLPETLVPAVATFAISAVWNTDLVKNPLLWTAERMTSAGKAFVESTTFQDWLGVDLAMPFFTPDTQPNWHTVAKPTAWRFSNLRNFVGRDFAIDSFFDSGSDFHMLFNTTLMTAVGVILVFVIISCFWKLLGKRTIFPQLDPQT